MLGLVLLLQEQRNRAEGRCRVEVDGLVAGAGEAAGEARAEGRCQVTVGMVGEDTRCLRGGRGWLKDAARV